jgi:hypothetical protein
MSWKGVPKKENYFPLFAEDWNLLVDAVDELYYTVSTRIDPTYVADFLPQAQETLKGILVNTVLARDLYETSSIEIYFSASDGALTVYTPPAGKRAVVRGWYAVSTATGGVARLKGAVTLTPVALVPMAAPSVGVPDIYLNLATDESLVLYYSGVSLGAYLQLLINILVG